MLLTPPNVYVKDTGTPKGRGVFARAGFAGGQVVEVCPVVLLHMPFEELPAGVERLVFNWERLAGVPGTQALALGYGSLYNHDNPANLRYEADGAGLLLRLTAVRDIPAGEELTINYNAEGGAPVWDDDNWFERMGVEPITRPRPAGRGRRRGRGARQAS